MIRPDSVTIDYLMQKEYALRNLNGRADHERRRDFDAVHYERDADSIDTDSAFFHIVADVFIIRLGNAVSRPIQVGSCNDIHAVRFHADQAF